MHPDKVVAVQDWSVPQSTFDIRSFITFTKFYRCFICNFCRIVHLLTPLIGKGVKFKWLKECQRAFERLRETFIKAPILTHFDLDKGSGDGNKCLRLCYVRCTIAGGRGQIHTPGALLLEKSSTGRGKL